MEISIVQSNAVFPGNGGGSNPKTVGTITTVPTLGNSIVMMFATNGGGGVSSVSDNRGNSLIQVVAASNSGGAFGSDDVEIWWLPNLASGSGAYTLSLNYVGPSSSGNTNACFYEVAGLLSVDQIGSASESPANNATSISATGAGANVSAHALVLACASCFTTGTSITTPPAGYANDFSQFAQIAGGSKIVSSVETSTASWSWTTLSRGAAVIATFAAAPLGGKVGAVVLGGNAPNRIVGTIIGVPTA